MFAELTISALRVWMFAPKASHINYPSLKEIPNLMAVSTTNQCLAWQLFLLGYTCNHWLKATLYLKQHSILFSNVKSTNYLGFFHFIIGSLLLNCQKSKKYLHISIGSLFNGNLIRRLLCYISFGVLIDEIVTLSFSLLFNRKFTIDGYPITKRSTNNQECLICLCDGKEPLKKFCTNNHQFHSKCIQKWYQPFKNFQTCPTCRQPLLFYSIPKLDWDSLFCLFNHQLVIRRITLHLYCQLIMYAIYFVQMKFLSYRIRAYLYYHQKS